MSLIVAFCHACARTVYLRAGDDPLFCPVCCSKLVVPEDEHLKRSLVSPPYTRSDHYTS
jgi:hypothetical protein